MSSRDVLHGVRVFGLALGVLVLTCTAGTTDAAPPPGSIAVQAFVDLDADGVAPVTGDPWLDGVHVTLSTAGSPVAEGDTVDGRLQFADLPPGEYTATADPSGWASISERADSDGGADWSVVVSVVSGAESPAAFTGRGAAYIDGWISYTSPFLEPTGVTASCTWSALDGTLATGDDVTFVATTQSAWPWVFFTLQHVPPGLYRCTAQLEDSTDVDEFELVDAHEALLTVGPPPTTGFNGYVAIDVDGDGRYSRVDKPLLGVEVRLLEADGTTLISSATTTLPFYYFTKVFTGSYVVEVPTAQLPGLTEFVGPEGDDGWVYPFFIGAAVDSPEWNFLARGSSTIEVKAVDGRTHAPVDTDVVCRWASVDGTLQTTDDVTWEGTTGADGRWSTTHAPGGAWTCEVGHGGAVARHTVVVDNGAHAVIELAVDADARPGTGLPGTGWSPTIALVALMFLAMGHVLTRASHRSR